MASEMGVLAIPEKDIVKKWRLQPGKMLLVDLEEGRLDSRRGTEGARSPKSHPYKDWLHRTQIVLEELPEAGQQGRDLQPAAARSPAGLRLYAGRHQDPDRADGQPIGEEATGSMGNDAPISALSDKSKLLYTYFKQNFAQVTNPPIDPIREEIVMSLVSIIGPRPNLFDIEGTSTTKRLEVRQPILTDADLEKIRSIREIEDNHFKSCTLDTTFAAEQARPALSPR